MMCRRKPAKNQHVADMKQKPLKRKRTTHVGEEAEGQANVQVKKRTKNEEKDATEKTEPPPRKMTAIDIFCSRYTMGRLLGTGGFSNVYAGIRNLDGKKVALKFIAKHPSDPYITLLGETRSLPLEVALMKLVCKPPCCRYIIALLDWLETATHLVLVLEQPDPCVDLYTYSLSQNRKVPEQQVKDILQQVIHAARHCHDRGVLHRDIKEENILLDPKTLEVKLIDFGCGDLFKDTPYTAYSGTDLFKPPEAFIKREYRGESATVWGLGVMICNLLCGQRPFLKRQEIVEGHVIFPDHLCEASRTLISWCLQKDPEKRPTLEQVLTHEWLRPVSLKK